MCRHTECDDAVVLAVELEIYRMVALVAIKDQEAISPNSSRFSLLIKVFDPFQTDLVSGPTIAAQRDDPVLRNCTILVPVGEMVLARGN